jgi:hypothetical protein
MKFGTSFLTCPEAGPSLFQAQKVNLVSFPVLSQIKPQAPPLVVPFRQFL